MTLKTKLISSISAFVLILTIVIVGVWAATQANIAMGGTINFQATNVYAKVSATVSGMDSNPTLPTLIFSEGENASSEEDIEKWSNLDLLFNSSATPIEISVTVENLSTERWLLVDIVEGLDNGKSDNINKEVKKENSDYTLSETHTLVPSTGEGTSKVEFTINLTVDDPNYSVNTVYDYIINLNNSNEAPPEPAKELDFIFSGNKVIGYAGNETNITIPTSYSMEKTPYNSFVLTAEELEQSTPEMLNKMAMLYALKNYTVYLNGQSEGGVCENGFIDFMSLTENLTDPAIFPLRVELPEDLTFELTEAELVGGQVTEETEFKWAALELLQNFYVQFGENSEEILCQNYDDFATKLSEIMPEGPKPEYFPLKFRIDYTSYKYVEGDDYQVEAIGAGAFINCSSLTSITIPEGVREIGEQAFAYCSSLPSIIIPEGVTEIGDYAFQSCSGLTSVSLSSTLTSIGNYAFRECTSLTSILIPERVTSIGQQAFRSCSRLTTITIPEGVTSIGNNAFQSCSILTSVSLPSTLTSIGESAFLYCFALAIVYNNSSLEITVGSSDNGLVGEYAKEIVSSGEEAVGKIEIVDGVQYYVNEQTGKKIALAPSVPRDSLTSITIREGTTEINQYAFDDCSSLTSITIPESVTSIGGGTFSGCRSLTTITIPEGVTSIGDGAFSDCYALAIVYNNSSLNITAGSYGNGYVGYYAEEIVTSENPQVGEIVVEGSVQYYVNKETGKEIALAPSVPRDSLTSTTIREGTKEINQYAFENCSNLTTITLPEGVAEIGEGAFYYCSSLTSITILEGMTSIGSGAFAYCSSLPSIIIPEGVTEIGQEAFSNCSSLTTISIPEGVTEIGEGAFCYCSSLTSITIPEGVTEIGGYFFRDCSSLTSIIIPEGVTSIGQNAFYGCSSLTSITIPEGVTSIGNYAFRSCSNLIEITINGNISSLGLYAFTNCSKLTSLTLGADVTSLPSNLFRTNYLTKLTKIVVLGNLNSSTFPSGTWVKDGGDTVTSFTGAGTYTRTDI